MCRFELDGPVHSFNDIAQCLLGDECDYICHCPHLICSCPTINVKFDASTEQDLLDTISSSTPMLDLEQYLTTHFDAQWCSICSSRNFEIWSK